MSWDLSFFANRFLSRITDPQSEFFVPYMLSALLATLLYLGRRHHMSIRESWGYLFRKDVWKIPSTRLDVILSLAYALAISIPTALANHWAFGAFEDLLWQPVFSWAPTWRGWDLSQGIEAVLLTLVITMAIDLATFVGHWLLHKVPFLWPYHAVHHAALKLNIFTTHRQHPLEPIYLAIFRGAFAGIAVVLFYRVFPSQHPPIVIMGLGGGFFIYMFTVNLHHLHVPVRYPRWLSYIFISPHIHHIHHSTDPRHYDKNFGVVFSFYDRIFGTYHDEDLKLDQLNFGLGDQDPFGHRLWTSLWKPIYLSLTAIADLISRTKLQAEKMTVDHPTLPANQRVSSDEK